MTTDWINYGYPYSYYQENSLLNKDKTFENEKLNVPGTQIELENGKIYLIGDINRNRGVCDDCTAFSDTAIVKRYRILIDLDIE